MQENERKREIREIVCMSEERGQARARVSEGKVVAGKRR